VRRSRQAASVSWLFPFIREYPHKGSSVRAVRRALRKRAALLLCMAGVLVGASCLHADVQPSDVAGVWEGHLGALGQTTYLVYRISVTEDGTLVASHDSPDYALNNIPVAEAKLDGDRVMIRIGLYDARYEGTVGKDVINGRYRYGAGPWLPLTLTRRSADPRFLLAHLVPRLGAGGRQTLDYRYALPAPGNDRWDVADAGAQGFQKARIDALMGRILEGGVRNLHCLVVIKDGKLVLDEYFHGNHRDKQHRISSVSKVITAATVGVAIDQGLIKDANTPLCQLFPQYGDLLCEGEKKQLTVYHLLTMTTGLQWNEQDISYFDPANDLARMKRSPDPLRNLFERRLVQRPGDRFVYNTGCMMALEALLQTTTKGHFLQFTQNGLFTPLGISNYRWDFSEGFFMTPRDMAKLGWLFLNHGEYGGARVLSAAWADNALGRFEQCTPRYFNHWWPMVFFPNGIPVKAFQAGGWGGQSITIFPALNMVIVITGGNQLEPADYDVCMRDYILPAIVTREYAAKHPAVAYKGLRVAKNLEWIMRWDTETGCMAACAKSLGLSIPDARLYGATGVGFLINIDGRAEAKSAAVWNRGRVYELCKNLGFSVDSIWSHKSSQDFPSIQKRVWDRVRQDIDAGRPCYGFGFDSPIRYLVAAYDDCGYYCKGWDSEQARGPLPWSELGNTDIGLLGMHFVRSVSSAVSYREMVESAFQFVLEFSSNSGQWVPADCKAGPEGYARWIALFEAGKEDEYGASYNAAQLAESRRLAVEFLEEAKGKLGRAAGVPFDDAIRRYRVVAEQLARMSQLLPHDVSAEQRAANLREPRRQEVIQCLRSAREAEVEGLKALAAIVETL